eukprot:scaffold172_cov355-Prasinococcus_capsulatus_cf.AAC.6
MQLIHMILPGKPHPQTWHLGVGGGVRLLRSAKGCIARRTRTPDKVLEDELRVLYCACHNAHSVQRRCEGDQAGPGETPVRRLESNHSAVGGRQPDRAPGVRAERGVCCPRRHCYRTPTAAPTGDERRPGTAS